jgi:SAM-dependent methyltransferase
VAVPLRDTAPSCGATRPQNFPSYDERTGDESEVNWGGRILWLLLPALASMMLLATTNHVCQDVAVIPFLWVAPLSIYLLTFILCFDREAWYSRRWCALGGMLTCGIVSLLLLSTSADHLLGEISVYFLALFFVCMLCHGELVRRKPSPRHLTSFYLSCSAGGALGGIFVALVCPRLFSTYFEMNLCLLLSYLLAVAVFAGHAAKALPKWHVAWKWAGPVAVFAGLLIVVRAQAVALRTEALDSARNFYGVLRVEEVDQTDRQHHARVLYHGRIAHGAQFVLPEKRGIPTTYYSPDSGAGLTLRRFPRRGPLRVGVIGLGVGTLAAYAQADDYYRFYEINPDVVMLAKRYFTFLAESAAPFDVILGDARLSLEREPPQRFDVLVLDAFSGDAIPTHLLTSEVFAVYLRHLRPDGIIAVNISNRYLDLVPVIDRLAADQQIDWVQIRTAGDAGRACSPAHWVLITHNQQFLHDDIVRAASLGEHGQYAHVPLWTDQYSNLFQILK